MDRWIAKKNEQAVPTPTVPIPTVSFFSFGPAAGILGAPRPHWPPNPRDYLYHFCCNAHVAALEFASENPGIRVVVKPKWGADWVRQIHDIWRHHGHDGPLPSNLIVDAEIDAQTLIRLVAWWWPSIPRSCLKRGLSESQSYFPFLMKRNQENGATSLCSMTIARRLKWLKAQQN